MNPVNASAQPQPADHDAALVDWDLASQTARRLVRPGPRVSAAQAHEAVTFLRRSAHRSMAAVAQTTHLTTHAGPPVLVVSRQSWAQANIQGFKSLLGPLLTQLMAKRRDDGNELALAVGRRVAGVEMGSLLALLASRILGQYDPFGASSDQASSGRLMLVAPNIMQVAQELDVPDEDFQLWVCLHEETHRVQFANAPWLVDHFRTKIQEVAGNLVDQPQVMAERVAANLRALGQPDQGPKSGTLLDFIQTPEEKRALQHLTATMSLLEGHADVVMDLAGQNMINDVEAIRDKFDQRRNQRFGIHALLKKLLGMEAKMRQYRDGAIFVRGVLDKVGMDGLNQVWEGPHTLPTPEEIQQPKLWVKRIHG